MHNCMCPVAHTSELSHIFERNEMGQVAGIECMCLSIRAFLSADVLDTICVCILPCMCQYDTEYA